MKVAYLMTYAFLGLLTLSFLMITMIKAVRHINFEDVKEVKLRTTMPVEDPPPHEEATQP